MSDQDDYQPDNLGPGGLKVWHDIADAYDLSPDATRLLEDAARTADMIDKLEQLAATSDPVVKGSMGQSVIHPAISELRQYRNVLARLLSALKLEVDQEAESAARSQKASDAARARWGIR